MKVNIMTPKFFRLDCISKSKKENSSLLFYYLSPIYLAAVLREENNLSLSPFNPFVILKSFNGLWRVVTWILENVVSQGCLTMASEMYGSVWQNTVESHSWASTRLHFPRYSWWHLRCSLKQYSRCLEAGRIGREKEKYFVSICLQVPAEAGMNKVIVQTRIGLVGTC